MLVHVVQYKWSECIDVSKKYIGRVETTPTAL